MRLRFLLTCVWCFAVLALAAPLFAATLDKGKLEVSWFSDDGVFREADEIDYLWVSEGFELDAKSLHFKPWPAPEFLGPKASERDEKDHQLAKMMSSTMHEVFASAFAKAYGDRIKTSVETGDILVEGRIVDSSTGSTAAKMWVGFGAGAGNTTIDVRFVDAASGKVLAGFHHRVVSGTSWSTTEGKFFNWVDETAESFAKKGMQKLYAKGKKVKE
jgi:curli biogenesis system outer membrane secretion channel CsgG